LSIVVAGLSSTNKKGDFFEIRFDITPLRGSQIFINTMDAVDVSTEDIPNKYWEFVSDIYIMSFNPSNAGTLVDTFNLTFQR
jgi:hypothetical protein